MDPLLRDGLPSSALADAMRHAYAHYSGFPVGAAALVDDGRVVTGCNVEIQLGGLTMCAENTMVGQLALTGGGRLVAFSCVDPAGELLLPCGRCRELLPRSRRRTQHRVFCGQSSSRF